mmetsp:Transcript_120096/g.233965  ORF Transcript_120096/g.233965 Transcript_120096/m.233965 type:complete len:259 (+) Transcript_120096:426-1202(+)
MRCRAKHALHGAGAHAQGTTSEVALRTQHPGHQQLPQAELQAHEHVVRMDVHHEGTSTMLCCCCCHPLQNAIPTCALHLDIWQQQFVQPHSARALQGLLLPMSGRPHELLAPSLMRMSAHGGSHFSVRKPRPHVRSPPAVSSRRPHLPWCHKAQQTTEEGFACSKQQPSCDGLNACSFCSASAGEQLCERSCDCTSRNKSTIRQWDSRGEHHEDAHLCHLLSQESLFGARAQATRLPNLHRGPHCLDAAILCPCPQVL